MDELTISREFVGMNQKNFKAVVAPVTGVKADGVEKHRGLRAAQTLPPC